MGGSWKLSEDNLPHTFDYELYHAPCGDLRVAPFRAEVWGLHLDSEGNQMSLFRLLLPFPFPFLF